MQPVPRIFVSATSRDLRTARGLVSEGLRRMECLPIVQDDFPPDYKSVRDMLRTKISTCNAVVHLAGFYYGAEPQPVLPGPDRRSFTQMEYEIAMELKLPCYVFLCGKNFPFDPHDPEPEDKQQLQLAHRERLLQRDELFYEFASPEELANRTRELQLSVENLRKELAKERGRRRLAMGAAVAALLITVVGGIWMHGRQQKTEAVNVQQTSEIASLKAQLEGPWVIVSKVNAAMELVSKESKAAPDEMKRVAIGMVAAELKKSPDEIRQAIDSTTQLAEKLIAAARAEGERDASKRAENRRLEAETLGKLAASHEAAARYKEALAAYTQRLELIDAKEQPEEWLDGLIEIADMEEELANHAEAGAKYQQGVEFGEANPSLGIGHPSTVFATERLCGFLRYTRVDPVAAEKLMRRTLERRETALGPDHAETLSAMGELAEILAKERKFDEAERLTDRALKGSEEKFGPQHATTMSLVENLASVLRSKGDLKNAIKLTERVQAYEEKKYGAESGEVLAGGNLLAGLYLQARDIERAEKLYRHVLEVRERTRGREHPDTLLSLSRLATLLAKKENYKEAEQLTRRVLATNEKVQGPEHPDTLNSARDLASILWDQEDLTGAEKLFRRVLDGRERVLGANHQYTIDSISSVGRILSEQKRYSEAEPFYRRALKARESTVKADDPKIATACFELASLLATMERPAEAIPLARRAVAIVNDSLSEMDPKRTHYAKFLARLTSPAPAEPAEPKAVKPPPSLAAFADLRKSINDKQKSEGWKAIKKTLPEAPEDRELTVTGWVDGKTLRKLMKVNAKDNTNGTWTFYYWSQGWLTSVLRVREGADVPVEGVAKATDTYNFWNGKLVSWRRTQDDAEKIEDPAENDFPALGKRINAEAEEASAPVLKAIGAE